MGKKETGGILNFKNSSLETTDLVLTGDESTKPSYLIQKNAMSKAYYKISAMGKKLISMAMAVNNMQKTIFGDTNIMFKQIKPGERVAGRISFNVDNLNRSFWLTLYDRRNKKTLTKISLDNAYKKVPEKIKKKNDKLKKKKNYFKEDPFEV